MVCEILAKYHHNEGIMKSLVDLVPNLVQMSALKELTCSKVWNSIYGSVYEDDVSNLRVPIQDLIDGHNKTGSYVDSSYRYNIGQSHAIDDFDEDSVWFYITMVEPVEDVNQVVELQDIMPFVFWWENRGKANNGPTASCYGRSSSSVLNNEPGGYCYSSGHGTQGVSVEFKRGEVVKTPVIEDE
jgi:hypothetical protein